MSMSVAIVNQLRAHAALYSASSAASAVRMSGGSSDENVICLPVAG